MADVGRFHADGEGLSQRGAWSPVWSTGQRALLTALLTAAAMWLAHASRAVDLAPGDSIVVAPTLKLDPNTAPSQVLGALPRVGPTLVRQLVLARQDRPLTSLEDLRTRVRGVGPATLEQIAPFLRFEPAMASRLDQLANSAFDRTSKKPRATVRKHPRSQRPDPTSRPAQLAARSKE
jgi:hypothetical protein